MIVIDDVILSDDIRKREFVCNLNKCKGACCVQGDGGAPLSDEEVEILPKIYNQVKEYMTPEGIETVERLGYVVQEDDEDYLSTPLRASDTACAYVNFSDDGITFCAIEKAFLAGKIDFQKPVSCHLYPIRVQEYEEFTAVNYHQWEICDPACSFGMELGVPLYKFVKTPLIRRFGEDFYNALEATIAHLDEEELESFENEL